MGEFLGSIWWLVVVLGVLITFHEFGHFWVARRMGVRVLRFSVGFGRALWSRTSRGGTEYVVAAIPLGGYVKMLDEREGPVAEQERHLAFNRKPVAARIAIVAAGPVFNLALAVVAFWIMFLVGVQEARPDIGRVSGLAAEAGVPEDARIVTIDASEVKTWTHVVLGLMGPALDGDTATVGTVRGDGPQRTHRLDFSQLEGRVDESRLLEEIGIQPWRPTLAPIIGTVADDMPAARAGLKPGDRILAINGRPVEHWRQVVRLIPELGADGREIDLRVQRDGRELMVAVTPESTEGAPPRVGIAPRQPTAAQRQQWSEHYFVLRHGPLSGLAAAGQETWRLTTSTIGMLGRMITGGASLQNLSGPITIARMANQSAQLGLSRFLFFMGLVSLSLGILNLLPIPILDGGHLMYYLGEALTGHPVPQRIQELGQYVGLLLLAGLMGLAFYNDILRLLS